MITAVRSSTIFVTDQDRALDFYTNTLGFELRDDQPMGPDSRWIEIAPPGAETSVVLYKPTQEMPGADSYEMAQSLIGKFSPIMFKVDNVDATYKDLSGRGVTFPAPASEQPWGWWAVLQDPDGNSFGLHE